MPLRALWPLGAMVVGAAAGRAPSGRLVPWLVKVSRLRLRCLGGFYITSFIYVYLCQEIVIIKGKIVTRELKEDVGCSNGDWNPGIREWILRLAPAVPPSLQHQLVAPRCLWCGLSIDFGNIQLLKGCFCTTAESVEFFGFCLSYSSKFGNGSFKFPKTPDVFQVEMNEPSRSPMVDNKNKESSDKVSVLSK